MCSVFIMMANVRSNLQSQWVGHYGPPAIEAFSKYVVQT